MRLILHELNKAEVPPLHFVCGGMVRHQMTQQRRKMEVPLLRFARNGMVRRHNYH